MAMMTTDRWLYLLGFLSTLGVVIGCLIGNWWAQRQCCECCTCENCTGSELEFIDGCPGGSDCLDADWHSQRRAVVLDPGPTIYPELAALAEQAIDSPQIDAERPDTGTFMRTIRLKWDLEYPIPGTPQWEARHPVGVS